MKIHLLSKGLGVSDGAATENRGALLIEFSGAHVDHVFFSGRTYAVVDGKVSLPTDGLTGILALVAHNRAVHKIYTCEDLYVSSDGIVPLPRFTPMDYVVMLDEAEKELALLRDKIKKREEAVFGIPLFGKEV